MNCAGNCAGGRIIGRVGGEKSKKPQYYSAFDRVKRCFDAVGVWGSNPHAPTNPLLETITRLFSNPISQIPI
jgi:hypothetical protein